MVFYKVQKQAASGLIFHADLTTASASRGFDQRLSVQERRAQPFGCKQHRNAGRMGVFSLDSAGVFLGGNLSADL